MRSRKITGDGGRELRIVEDANFDDARRAAERAKYTTIRGFRDPNTGRSYVWDAMDAIHYHAIKELGFDPALIPETAQWSVEIENLTPEFARSVGLRGVP
jgi:hypothetical protein